MGGPSRQMGQAPGASWGDGGGVLRVRRPEQAPSFPGTMQDSDQKGPLMSADYPYPADVDLGDWPGRDHGLTAREAEIVALITQGLRNEQIADRMFLSVN